MEIYNDKKLETKKENYEMILREIKNLSDLPLISRYSSLASLIFNYIDNVSWAGVYLYDKKFDSLFVGPYQGKPACLQIKMGKGQCGSAMQERTTKICKDVRLEANHIFCDGATLSEIVVPMVKDGLNIGVIDLDSTVLENFDEIDKYYLEEISKLLME